MARRAEAFGRSPWTFIDQYLDHHPDLIYFGNGAPAAELYPVDALRMGAATAWAEIGPSELDYGELQGYAPLRRLIADRMSAQGFDVDPDQILLTSAASRDRISARLMPRSWRSAGGRGSDLYRCAAGVRRLRAGISISIRRPGGPSGGCPDRRRQATGRRAEIIYVIPNFQNPYRTDDVRVSAVRGWLRSRRRSGRWSSRTIHYGEFWYDTPPPPHCGRRRIASPISAPSRRRSPGTPRPAGWSCRKGLMGRALMAKESSEVCGVRPTSGSSTRLPARLPGSSMSSRDARSTGSGGTRSWRHWPNRCRPA